MQNVHIHIHILVVLFSVDFANQHRLEQFTLSLMTLDLDGDIFQKNNQMDYRDTDNVGFCSEE